MPILAIEVDCKRKKSDHRRCARHNGRVREDPGRQQPCWGSLFCTNLTQPTAALDPQTAKKVLELTSEIVEEQRLTALMVTHNMKDAIQIGNRLIMMNDGHIIYDVRGEEKKNLTVDDLLKKFAEASGKEFANDRMMLAN